MATGGTFLAVREDLMQRRLAIMVCRVGLIGAGLALTGACGGDSAPSRDEMVDQAIEEIGIDEATAACLVDGLIDKLGSERVEELVTSNEDTEDMSDEEQGAVDEVSQDCLATEDPEDPGVSIAPTVTVDPDAGIDPEVTTGG